MAFWNNKPQETPQPAPSAPKPAASPSSFVDPDDFFKDMGRRPKAPKDETTVASPEITGLREAPPPDPEIILAGLNTDAVQTDGLIDKAALDDGHYHGFMDDI
ncbi:MAG: hypothetical protein IJZ72_01930 [Oscillospiraceae bacterium]|nr:hypothetical protein [Oscillospiraceae bacterium]